MFNPIDRLAGALARFFTPIETSSERQGDTRPIGSLPGLAGGVMQQSLEREGFETVGDIKQSRPPDIAETPDVSFREAAVLFHQANDGDIIAAIRRIEERQGQRQSQTLNRRGEPVDGIGERDQDDSEDGEFFDPKLAVDVENYR